MKKLSVKEILNLSDEELAKMMTDEQYDRMRALRIEHVGEFLDLLQESAIQSKQSEDEEHVTIDEYLDYLEEMKSSGENY